MGVFGAVFGCSGDDGFMLACISDCSGVGGFNVAMLLCFVHEKVRHAWLVAGGSGTKFAMHAKNAPKRAILGEQGEFCTAHAVRRGVLGEFCTGSGPARFLLGEFCAGSSPVRFLLGEFCLASAPPLFPVAVLPSPVAQRRGQAVQSPPAWSASQCLPHRQWWWFCTFRSWLSACRRRVAPLMTPLPPFGDRVVRPRGLRWPARCAVVLLQVPGPKCRPQPLEATVASGKIG